MLTRRGIELPSESKDSTGGSPRKALKCKRSAEDKAASTRWNDVVANRKREKQVSIAWAFQVNPDRQDAADRPSTGVRRIPGRSGADCMTFYKDNPSIKTFPEQKNRSYLSHALSSPPAAAASATAAGLVAAPCPPHTPREVTGKVSCEGSSGSPNPPFLSIRKMHIRRPEITALDSYDIPVYSCFSRDHAFHPVLDDAMKKYRERRAHQVDQVREKLQKAAAYHTTVVVKQFAEAEEGYRRLVETSQPFVSVPRGETALDTPRDRKYDPHEELKAKQAAQGTVIPLPPSQVPFSVSTPGRDHRGSVAGPSPPAARRDTTSPLSNRSESVEGVPPPSGPVAEDKQAIAPKPPVAPSPTKRRPHTAGPSRILQHTVLETNGADAPSELIDLIRPTSASTAARGQAAPVTPQPKVRPHSAKPIASVSMAVDCGGILGSQPLIQLLNSPRSARSSAPRSHLTDSIDSRMKQFRRMSTEGGDDGLTDTPSTF